MAQKTLPAALRQRYSPTMHDRVRHPPAHETTAPAESRRLLRNVDDLVRMALVAPHDVDALKDIEGRYATAVPPAFQDLIQTLDDPIARQVIPSPQEATTQAHENPDPIGDDALSPVPGIVHRYADRALLKPLLICPLYCRFCFRREHVGPDGGLLSEADLTRALDWVAHHTEIREIILTGGDPLMLSARRLKPIMERLSSIPHIETIRIHSRVPVADPTRITTEMLDALDTDRALWLVVHINHARELTPAARLAIRSVQARAIPVLSQSVLLRGVNDTEEALEALLRSLVAIRIKPYYLHHLDAAPGTSHFHVPIAEGQALLRRLRGRVTGLAWPTYVLDLPGGKGKVPIGPTYLHPEDATLIRTPDGTFMRLP